MWYKSQMFRKESLCQRERGAASRTGQSGINTHATKKRRMFPVSQTELLPVASEDAWGAQKILYQRQSARHGMWISLLLFLFFFLFFFKSFFHFFFLFIYFFNFILFYCFKFSLLRYHRWGKHTESKPLAQSPNTAVQLKP